MSHFFLGETDITNYHEKIKLLILTFEDYSKEKPMNWIQGKDYIIGYDSFVFKIIDKKLFMMLKWDVLMKIILKKIIIMFNMIIKKIYYLDLRWYYFKWF